VRQNYDDLIGQIRHCFFSIICLIKNSRRTSNYITSNNSYRPIMFNVRLNLFCQRDIEYVVTDTA